jgi:hypothetical protein
VDSIAFLCQNPLPSIQNFLSLPETHTDTLYKVDIIYYPCFIVEDTMLRNVKWLVIAHEVNEILGA